jgi:hypothetical protein
MVDPQHNARVRAPAPVRPAANVWDEYERITDEWNQSAQVQERYTDRNRMINNTAGYHTGNNMLHICSIQMYNAPDWNALFGAEQLDPLLREYVFFIVFNFIFSYFHIFIFSYFHFNGSGQVGNDAVVRVENGLRHCIISCRSE